jgi:type I restriction enzyme M protein
MAIKKSQLYSSLWQSCDELRGGMDASQYKDYVLVLLFVKYVSDKAATQRDYLLEVPEGGSFADMVALKNKKEIGDGMNKIVARLAEANDLKGVIDVSDWNDSDRLGRAKDMVDRLTRLVGIFESLDFRGNRADGDDLLGDAYEYLMRHFATESGKSKGQFYTPAEVSRVMAQVVGVRGATHQGQTIHDPTCGSGSLLIQAHEEARAATGLDLALYGQEMDNATRALARMNMILHNCITGEIAHDNTLSSPQFTEGHGRLKTFDFVVANPPFSTKGWTHGVKPDDDEWRRFGFGVPPQKNGDYAFLLHILATLKSTGKGAVILPHGVLFRGGAEGSIRREIVRRGYIKGIIGLPANLFYGTGIPACIIVLDKEGAASRDAIFMIDASRGFAKDGNKNRLREQDIHRIVDTFTRDCDVPRYARRVPLTEISDARNDYNLNLPRYVDTSEPEDLHDLHAHMNGGIPDRDLDAFDAWWQVFPTVRQTLFAPLRPGYSQLRVPAADIRATIFDHPEFSAWSTATHARFATWKTEAVERLIHFRAGDPPKGLVNALAEALLQAFDDAPLVDAYDIYQHLMEYWSSTLYDDLDLITVQGWLQAAQPRLLVDDGDTKSREKPDFTLGRRRYKADLLPPALIERYYFSDAQSTLAVVEADLGAVQQAMEELAEEHATDDGLLADARNDRDKVTRATAAARLRTLGPAPAAKPGKKGAATATIAADPDSEERATLQQYLDLADREATLKAQAKDQRDALTEQVARHYATLTEDDVKTLVVHEKWLATLEAAIQTEIDRASQTLTTRIRDLADRYDRPLPDLEDELVDLAERVDEHLKKMGVAL